MVNEARQVLREHYFKADVGITGGNFLIAETGSSIIVTNEGNGDLTQTLARVHIVTSGIERVVPTLDDAADLPAPAGAQRHRPGDRDLHHREHRPAPRRRPRRPAGVPRGAGRQRPLEDARRPVPRDAALHPLRRLPEPLPGLHLDRRPCLRLGLPGPDGLGADAADQRHRQRLRPAQRLHAERPLPDGVPGEDPAARPAARTAAPAVRKRPDAGADPLGAAGLGGAGQARRAVPPGHAHRHPAAQPLRPPPRRPRLAAAGRRLDRHARPAGAAGRHLPAGLERAQGSTADERASGRERCWPTSASRSDAARRAPTPSSPCPAAGRGRPSKATWSSASWPRCSRSRPRWCASPRWTRSAPRSQRFLASIGAGPRLCVSKALAGIAWPARCEVEYRAAVRADQTSVTPCFAAVAESGGIVTLSGPDTPSTLNFVPDNHIVIVHAAQVVRALRGRVDAVARHRPAVAAHRQHHLRARRARPTSSRRSSSARTGRAGCTSCWSRQAERPSPSRHVAAPYDELQSPTRRLPARGAADHRPAAPARLGHRRQLLSAGAAGSWWWSRTRTRCGACSRAARSWARR